MYNCANLIDVTITKNVEIHTLKKSKFLPPQGELTKKRLYILPFSTYNEKSVIIQRSTCMAK